MFILLHPISVCIKLWWIPFNIQGLNIRRCTIRLLVLQTGLSYGKLLTLWSAAAMFFLIGDMYLKHFADIASEIFRDHGNVYRFGGDEFVAIYHGIIPQTTIDRLTECREWDKEAPCPFNQVSTGVLFCRPPHQSTEQILHQVDELMYQNKMKKHTRTS